MSLVATQPHLVAKNILHAGVRFPVLWRLPSSTSLRKEGKCVFVFQLYAFVF